MERIIPTHTFKDVRKVEENQKRKKSNFPNLLIVFSYQSRTRFHQIKYQEE